MPCYAPLQAWRSRRVNPATGKRGVVFKRSEGFEDMPLQVPCGQCIGCRLEKSRQWAIRCVHEASLYDDNCFITLTYDDAHLPYDGSLNKKHFQDFMKRLRKRFGEGIRFFHCGEYGEQFRRPHYHACLFNFDFSDKVLYKITHSGMRLYNSSALSELWPFGFSVIGSVTFESAAYVARYICKKITGEPADEHYQVFRPDTGEVFKIEPEYCTMSRRPGLGKGFYEKYKDDLLKNDYVVINGKTVKPPKFYDALFERECLDHFKRVKALRRKDGESHAVDNTLVRLRVRELVKESRLSTLSRDLEEN